jgi:hypothetical protein
MEFFICGNFNDDIFCFGKCADVFQIKESGHGRVAKINRVGEIICE